MCVISQDVNDRQRSDKLHGPTLVVHPTHVWLRGLKELDAVLVCVHCMIHERCLHIRTVLQVQNGKVKTNMSEEPS